MAAVRRVGPGLAGALAVLALCATGTVLRVQAMGHALAAETYEDAYYAPPPRWLPLFSLGHDEALADLFWCRVLVYFGDELMHQGSVRYAFDYVDAILELDPRFRAPYRWIGMVAFYRPQGANAADARRAIEIMERGHDLFPDDGQLAWSVGAALAFELPGLLETPEEKDLARAEGLEYLMQGVRLGGAPEWATLSNAAMLARLGRADQAARHLEEMYASVEDEATRAQIGERIAQLRSSTHAAAFVEMNREFEERRRAELPYVPWSFYYLVGPRPVIDVRAVLRDGIAAHVFDDEPQLDEGAVFGSAE